MSDNATRLKFLEESHRKLDEDIQKGYDTFMNDYLIAKMKVQKLRIKDAIEELKKEVNHE